MSMRNEKRSERLDMKDVSDKVDLAKSFIAKLIQDRVNGPEHIRNQSQREAMWLFMADVVGKSRLSVLIGVRYECC